MTGHNTPFFESTLTHAAHQHLKIPGAFVGFIMGRDVFAQAVELEEGNTRAFRIRTPNGATLVLDRHAVLGLDLGFLEGFSEPVEKTAEEIAAEESMGAWTAALETLRTAAAGTKDKAVLAALEALVEVEKAAEAANAGDDGNGDGEGKKEGDANGGA